jgi:hypothetical protein
MEFFKKISKDRNMTKRLGNELQCQTSYILLGIKNKSQRFYSLKFTMMHTYRKK